MLRPLNKPNRNPEQLALQRRQIDAKNEGGARHAESVGSWIRAVRTALGMSAAQLAKRIGVTQQAVANAERSERDGAISIATLRKIAEALDCDLVYEFKPRTLLEDTVRRQATAKARAERDRVVHTMRLEAQHDGVEQALDIDEAVRQWMSTRIAHLWD